MAFDDPAASRPRPARRTPNEQSLLSLGSAIERRSAGPSHRRRRGRRPRRMWLRWTIVGVAVVVVLALVAVVADALYLNSLLKGTEASAVYGASNSPGL